MKYLKCETCGNVIAMIKDSGVTPQCCGQDMVEVSLDDTLDTNSHK